MRYAVLLKLGLVRYAQVFVRGAERVLPPSALSALLTPPAAAWSLLELLRLRPRVREFDQLPASWHRSRTMLGQFGRLWHQRTLLNSAKALSLIPDRLNAPRWKSRFVIHNAEHFHRLRAGGRPVILVTLHYGPVAILLHWLRSAGVPAAALVDRNAPPPRYRALLNERVDREANLEAVPRLFFVEQTWDIADFLRAGQVLLIAIDGDRGASRVVEDSDVAVRLATGPLTLAGVTDAAIIPCLMVARPGLCIDIHLGDPVPAGLVADRAGYNQALRFLLSTFRPTLQSHPEQCSWELLRRISPMVATEEPSTVALHRRS